MNAWKKPEFLELTMSAEIGAYQPDDAPPTLDLRYPERSNPPRVLARSQADRPGETPEG
jgi:hypothetical protein